MTKPSDWISGKFSVDGSGGACYNIPLEIPPGTAGVQPALSLSYNSGRGLDLLGVGWTLKGLPVIERVAATRAQDGKAHGVDYSDKDHFTLDGQRLIGLPGPDPVLPLAKPTSFRVEVDNGQVALWHPTSVTAGPDLDWWTVVNQEGLRMEFGRTVDSRPPINSRSTVARCWGLSRVVDLCGNEYTVKYEPTSERELRVAYIDYTANPANGLTARRRIRFAYDQNVDFPARHFSGGVSTGFAALLSGIVTEVDQQTVSEWKFSYENSPETSRLRLNKITGPKGDTTITYNPAPAPLGEFALIPNIQTTPDWSFLPIDIDGDGTTDLLFFGKNGDAQLRLMIFQGRGNLGYVGVLDTIVWFAGDIKSVMPIDMDGDGVTELLVGHGDAGRAILYKPVCTGGVWSLTEHLTGIQGDFTLLSGDLDASGKMSPIAITKTGDLANLHVYPADYGTQVEIFAAGLFGGIPVGLDSGFFFPIDVDGDGQTDIVRVLRGDATKPPQMWIAHSNTNCWNWDSNYPYLASPNSNVFAGMTADVFVNPCGTAHAGDVNGDGFTDLIWVTVVGTTLRVWTLYNTGGGGFVMKSTTPQTYEVAGDGNPQLYLADVDGDGCAELVVFASAVGNELTACSVIRLESEQLVKSWWIATRSPAAGGNYVPADLLGTGKTGFICYSAAGAVGYFHTLGVQPDLPATLVNELGGTVSMTFSRLTDPAVYRCAPCAQWAPDGLQSDRSVAGTVNTIAAFHAPAVGYSAMSGSLGASRLVRFPKAVVASYKKTEPRGSSAVFEYFYSGARVDLRGRGWLGFDTIRVGDVAQGTVREMLVSQVFPYVGTILGTSVQRGSAAVPPGNPGRPPEVYTATLTSFESRQKVVGKYPVNVYQVCQLANEEWIYDQAAAKVCEKQISTMEYDLWGNCTSNLETNLQADASGAWRQVSALKKVLSYAFYARALDGTGTLAPEATPVVPTDDRWITIHLASVTALDENGTVLRRRTQTVDGRGLLLTSTDGGGPSKQYAYDFAGNCTKIQRVVEGALVDDTDFEYETDFHTFIAAVKSPPNAAGLRAVVRHTHDPRTGVVLTHLDPNNVDLTPTDPLRVITVQTVDALGRITGVTGAGETPGAAAFTYSRHRFAAGTRYDTLFENWSGSSVLESVETCDGWGRVARRSDPNFAGDDLAVLTRYDTRDNIVCQSSELAGGGRLQRERTYDAWNRLVRETLLRFDQPDAGPVSVAPKIFEWTSNFECGVTEAGNPEKVLLRYGTFNGQRLVLSRVSNPGDPKGAETTTFVYDSLGRVREVHDSAGVVTKTRYDALDRVVSRAVYAANGDPLSGDVTVYDDVARTAIRTDELHNVVTTTFDLLGRVLTVTATPSVEAQAAGAVVLTTTNTWDLPGRANAIGRLGRVVCSDGSTHDYTYDANGNEIIKVVSVGGKDYTFRQAFTPHRRVAQLIFPNGAQQINGYGRGAQQSCNFVPAPDSPSSREWSAKFNWCTVQGQKQLAIDYPNRTAERATYDVQNRLVAQTFDANGARFATSDLVRSSGGDPTTVGATDYDYDAHNRLATWGDPAGKRFFEYADGDLIRADRLAFTSTNHRVTALAIDNVAAGAFQYDGNGSVVSAKWMAVGGQTALTQTLAYDAFGRLRQCDSGAVTLTARYDHTGRRIEKTITDTATQTAKYTLRAIAPNYEVTEFATGEKQTVLYLTSANGVFAQISDRDTPAGSTARKIPAGLTILHKDHRGSTIATSDGNGLVSPVASYAPFGELVTGGATLATRRLFTGAEYDDETGFYYFQSRYYHPRLGRFLQADDRQGGLTDQTDAFHSYAYALNRPLTFVDPSGHAWYDVFKDIGFFLADIGLIVAGAFVTPFCAPAGGMLIGAGVGGLVYNVTALARGEEIDAATWGIQLAIGAATGLVSGGAASMASSAAASVGSQLARVAIQVVFAAAAGTVTGVGGQVIQNAANHVDLASGLGEAAWKGAAIGAATGALSAFGSSEAGMQLKNSVVGEIKLGVKTAISDMRAGLGMATAESATAMFGPQTLMQSAISGIAPGTLLALIPAGIKIGVSCARKPAWQE